MKIFSVFVAAEDGAGGADSVDGKVRTLETSKDSILQLPFTDVLLSQSFKDSHLKERLVFETLFDTDDDRRKMRGDEMSLSDEEDRSNETDSYLTISTVDLQSVCSRNKPEERKDEQEVEEVEEEDEEEEEEEGEREEEKEEEDKENFLPQMTQYDGKCDLTRSQEAEHEVDIKESELWKPVATGVIPQDTEMADGDDDSQNDTKIEEESIDEDDDTEEQELADPKKAENYDRRFPLLTLHHEEESELCAAASADLTPNNPTGIYRQRDQEDFSFSFSPSPSPSPSPSTGTKKIKGQKRKISSRKIFEALKKKLPTPRKKNDDDEDNLKIVF